MSYENATTSSGPGLCWQEYQLMSSIDHTVQVLPTTTPVDTPLPTDDVPFPDTQALLPPVAPCDAAWAPFHHAQYPPPGLGWPHAPVSQVYYNWVPQVPQDVALDAALPQDAGYGLQIASINSDFPLQELTPETAAYLSGFAPVLEADYIHPDSDPVVESMSAPEAREYGLSMLDDFKPMPGLPLSDLSLGNDLSPQATELKPFGLLEFPQDQVDPARNGMDALKLLHNLELPVVVPTPRPGVPRTSSVVRTSRKKPNKAAPYKRQVLRLPQVQTGTSSGSSTPSPITSGSSIVPQRYKHVPSPGSESDKSDTRILNPDDWEIVIRDHLNIAFLVQPASLPHLGDRTTRPPQEYLDHICTYINPHSGEGCWTKKIPSHSSEWLKKRTNGKRCLKGFFGRHRAEILRHMAWHRYQELKPLMVRVPTFDSTALLQSSTPQSALTGWSHSEIDHQLREDLARPNEQIWCKGEERLSKKQTKELLSVSPLFIG